MPVFFSFCIFGDLGTSGNSLESEFISVHQMNGEALTQVPLAKLSTNFACAKS